MKKLMKSPIYWASMLVVTASFCAVLSAALTAGMGGTKIYTHPNNVLPFAVNRTAWKFMDYPKVGRGALKIIPTKFSMPCGGYDGYGARLSAGASSSSSRDERTELVIGINFGHTPQGLLPVDQGRRLVSASDAFFCGGFPAVRSDLRCAHARRRIVSGGATAQATDRSRGNFCDPGDPQLLLLGVTMLMLFN